MYTIFDGQKFKPGEEVKLQLDYIHPHIPNPFALAKTKCKEHVYNGTKPGPRLVKAQHIQLQYLTDLLKLLGMHHQEL